jgi:hypothetical protein
MRSYVAVSSSCCLLYLLLQRGSQGGRARGVAAAVAALPFLLSCASDLHRCLRMSQSMWPLTWLEVNLWVMCGRRLAEMSKDSKYKAVRN